MSSPYLQRIFPSIRACASEYYRRAGQEVRQIGRGALQSLKEIASSPRLENAARYFRFQILGEEKPGNVSKQRQLEERARSLEKALKEAEAVIERLESYTSLDMYYELRLFRELTPEEQNEINPYIEKIKKAPEDELEEVAKKAAPILSGYLDGTILDANPTAAEFLGIPLNRAGKITMGELIAPEDLPTAIENALKILNQKTQRGLEYEIVAGDKSQIPVSINAKLIDANYPFIIRGVVRDISRLKRVKEELQKNQERLKAILDALPDLCFEVDREGVIHDFYSSAIELLYLQPKDFIGKKIEEIGFPTEVKEVLIKAIKEAAEKGKHTGASYSLKINGDTKWFEPSIAPKEGPDGRLIALVRDITKRKQAEEEAIRLQLRQNEMEASASAIKGLIHALSQKFQALIGYVNLAEKGGTIMKIKGNLFSASEIATDISKYFKMFGVFTMGIGESRSIEVKSFADRILKETIAKFPDNNFKTNVAISTVETIDFPPDIFSIILESLLTNAFEAIKNDGRVTLSVNKESRGGQEGFLIKVDDDGRGLSPKEQIAIFRPFYSTKPYAIALQRGLPLAVVHYAIHRLNGKIDVKSEVGRGSSFQIWFPFERD